jgi:arabinofuranosyltransferase
MTSDHPELPAPTTTVDDREPAPLAEPAPRPTPGDLGVLGLAIALYAACIWPVRRFVTDDAYISLRYARNLADGHGPVWNPGGPATEGFTNPLLVFAEAVVYRLSGAGPGFAQALGMASGLALVVVVWSLGRQVVDRWAANAAAVLVAGSPALAYWAAGGLETLPYTLAVVTAALLLARPDGGPHVAAAVLLATLPWLRAEGLGVAAALVFFSEVAGLVRAPTRRTTIRRLLWLAGLPLISQLALQALRWVWFGHLLPNSVIYKAGTGTFGEVTSKFLVEIAPVAPLAVAGFALVRGRARLLAAVPVAYAVASLTFRDSVNTYSRLVLAALPLLLLLAAAALPGGATMLRESWQRRSAVLTTGTAALLGYLLVLAPASLRDAANRAEGYMGCRAESRQAAGEWLRDHTDADASFAMGDSGVTPYVARRTHYDLFHLNEASIQETGPLTAQERAEWAHEVAPDYFVLASRDAEEFHGDYGTDRRVHRHDGFAAYELETVAGPPPGVACNYHLFIYRRS